jgi:hypothetical protein
MGEQSVIIPIEIRLTDIPETAALIAEIHALAAELRELVRPSPPYWSRKYYAERVGGNIDTMSNPGNQWMWPPFSEGGDNSRLCIKREDGERYLRMTREEKIADYKRRMREAAKKLRVV